MYGIVTYIGVLNGVNVCNYSSPMDGLGTVRRYPRHDPDLGPAENRTAFETRWAFGAFGVVVFGGLVSLDGPRSAVPGPGRVGVVAKSLNQWRAPLEGVTES